MNTTNPFLNTLKHLYLMPNPFQIWAWVLTPLAILFLFKPTRRFGGTWLIVVTICMGVFFGVMKMMSDFAPTGPPPDQPLPAKKKNPWR